MRDREIMNSYIKNSKFDIDKIMEKLMDERKVFHSEDDLKFSLATVIKEEYENADVRLERPMEIEMVKRPDGSKPIQKKISIDITVFLGYDVFFLELKYKTKKLSKDFEKKLAKNIDIDYEFNLTNQQAQPISRFLFRKDIYRLEKLIEISKNKGLCKGYFIVITNDNKYEMKEENLSKNYSFHNQPYLVAPDEGWNYETIIEKDDDHWTKSGNGSFKLDLKKNKYKVEWKRYFPEEKENETKKDKKEAFRYCIVEINK